MKFTIITVVKNDKKNLLTSLKSAISQKCENFEHIIYDGISNDGTKHVIKKYLSKNIRYIQQNDQNYYDGLNKAIKIAKGDYIGILNAGDQYVNSIVLKKIFKKILISKCDLLFGNLEYLSKKNKISRVWKYPVKTLNKFTALKIASPTLFIKKKILLSNLYKIKYNISSDTDFNLTISKKNYKFIYYNMNMIYMKGGGLSTNKKFFLKKMKQDLEILFKHFNLFGPIIYLYKISFKLRSLFFFNIDPNKK
jgi:glycosyltransferase involved in cell wall biosynthesis|tara:strand:- start:3769 stop:4521 length:753 start_codon:yes stop_codon:yes gene_type:complete